MNAMTSPLWRRWWLVPVLVIVAGASVAVNLGSEDAFHPMRSFLGGAAAAVLALLGAGVLFAVDRWPSVAIVNGALVGAYFAVGGESGPIFITFVVAAYLLASRRSFRVWFPLVLASGVLVWLGLVIRAVRWDEVTVGSWQAFGIGALVSAAASIGTAVRAHDESRQIDRRRVATEEQLRMAQELHDGVGHTLAVIAIQSGVALHVLERDQVAARKALETIRSTSTEALDSLRAELSQMTGQVTNNAPRFPRRSLAELDVLLERVRSGGVQVDTTGVPDGVDETTSEAAYAIVQESLTNVLRHADATEVSVAFEFTGDMFEVTIEDDGRSAVMHDEGMGLRGMRERASALGGSLVAGSTGHGFRVQAKLPVRR